MTSRSSSSGVKSWPRRRAPSNQRLERTGGQLSYLMRAPGGRRPLSRRSLAGFPKTSFRLRRRT